MIHKCANTQCSEPFRYMRAGKLFQVDREQIGQASADNSKPSHNVEHFWLCGRCAETLTLVYERGRGVITRPLSELRRAS
jgi:hypothetical protein